MLGRHHRDAAIRKLVDQAFDRATAILRACATTHPDSTRRLLDKETFGEDDLAPIWAAVKECVERSATTIAVAACRESLKGFSVEITPYQYQIAQGILERANALLTQRRVK